MSNKSDMVKSRPPLHCTGTRVRSPDNLNIIVGHHSLLFSVNPLRNDE